MMTNSRGALNKAAAHPGAAGIKFIGAPSGSGDVEARQSAGARQGGQRCGRGRKPGQLLLRRRVRSSWTLMGAMAMR